MEQNKQELVGTKTLLDYASQYLQSFNDHIQAELEALNKKNGEKILKKNLNALSAYVDAKYTEGSYKKTEDEIRLILQDLGIKNLDSFAGFVEEWCYKPFKEGAAEQFEDTVSLLSGIVYAINKKDLIEKIGEVKSERTYQFVLDCFHLTLVKYRFESFRDPELETLYSNDGLRLDDYKARGFVNAFFRFFIDGDVDKKKKTYDPEKYYGCLPVQESRVIAYCKQKSIPENYIEKLLAIARCSARFIVNDKGELSLKKQYLNNVESLAVAILFEHDKPMHKKDLLSQIGRLKDMYPALIAKPPKDIHDERKPILCQAGGQGTLMLETGRQDHRDKHSIIRDYVAKVFSETQEAVPLDQIVAYLESIGLHYDNIKSVQTFVTEAGCEGKGKGFNAYYPAGSGLGANDRFWKAYILRQEAAEYLLAHGRQASRKEIKAHITKKYGHSINGLTFDRALFESEPCYFTKVGTRANQKVALSEKIKNKTDIKIAFPEPEKKEVAYRVEIRQCIINYLIKKEKALQDDLVNLFYDKTPKHLSDRKGPVRIIMKDDTIFLKEKLGDKQIQVTLQPRYIEKLKLEGKYPTQEVAPSPQPNEPVFSWEGLKEGIIKTMSPEKYDEKLADYVENMFFIMRGGYDELLPTSNFKDSAEWLFKYVTSQTSFEDRFRLRKELLSMMEAYFKEFYRLKYNDGLEDIQNLGEIKRLFIEKGLLPDKNDYITDAYLRQVAYAVSNVHYKRNNKSGHPKAFSEKSDKQTTSDIHDCLLVMLYLAKKL